MTVIIAVIIGDESISLTHDYYAISALNPFFSDAAFSPPSACTGE